MGIFEYKQMLVEIVYFYPADDHPVTMECTDLRSEKLFDMYRDLSGELVLRAISDKIPLDVISLVGKIAEKELPRVAQDDPMT